MVICSKEIKHLVNQARPIRHALNEKQSNYLEHTNLTRNNNKFAYMFPWKLEWSTHPLEYVDWQTMGIDVVGHELLTKALQT